MSFAADVAQRAKKDLERRREVLTKEIDYKQAEVKEIDQLLASIKSGQTKPSVPKLVSKPKTNSRATKRSTGKLASVKLDKADNARAAGRMGGRPSNRDRLLRHLETCAAGSIDRDEIVKFLDSTEQSVRNLLSELVKENKIKIVGEDDNERVVLA